MADLNALIAQGAQFQAPVDPFAQYGKMQQLQQGLQANQLNQMKMEEYQRNLQEQNALRGLDPAAADYLAQVKKVNPKLGFEFEKAANEAANLKLTGTKTQAEIAEGKRKLLDASLRNMASNPSDENIIAHTQDYALNPLFKDELPSIQANAKRLLAMTLEQRKAVLSGAGATAGDLSTAESARLGRLTTERGQDIGATTAYRGQDIGAATATRGQDIGAATAAEGQKIAMRGQDIGASTAAAGQQVTIRGQNLTDARARQNIAIARERLNAEMATGNLTPATIDFIAETYRQTGTLPPLGMGPMAAAARSKILTRAGELAMGGGATAAEAAAGVVGAKQDVAAQTATLKDFSSGVSSRRVTANNTALNHLETLDKLAGDLANSDIRVVNAAGNAFAKATGSSAPTSFDAAKQLVASEVIKAVTQNGGGVTERQEAAKNITSANSPEQLKGITQTYRDLLGGQLTTLAQQYETGTGRKDFEKKLSPTTRDLLNKSKPAPAVGGFKYLGKE
jgi:hypothetical protein